MLNSQTFQPRDKYATQTDHVFIPIIELNIPVKTRWGSGLYHFNNTLLKNLSFKSEIENIFESWRLTKSNFQNLLNWWDTGKSVLAQCSKNVSIMLKKAEKLNFENDTQRLETLCNSQNLSDCDKTLKQQLSKRIQDYYCKKFDGARIRSKEREIENETPSEAFFIIEKENAACKNITQLKTENGTIIENKDEVLSETQNFYNNLWETDHQLDQLVQNDYVKIMVSSKFDQQDADDIKKLSCENEVFLAILVDQLNKVSSPGADGLASKFLRNIQVPNY